VSKSLVDVRMPQNLDMAQELESQSIGSSLDRVDYTLLGRRNRIFVLLSGSGQISYLNDVTALAAPTLIWVPTGTPAVLTLFAGSRGAWLAISDAALGQVALPGNIADDIRTLSKRPQLVTRIRRDAASQLINLMTILEQELRDGEPGSEEMLRHHMSIVAILLWRSSEIRSAAKQPAPRALVSNFLLLVDQHMRRHWSIRDYARYLGVSVDRLNSATLRATGQTPLAVIHARIMAEARQMLESSGMQISEIAINLGFEDAAYFSRFFKRQFGKSPREYRHDFSRKQVSTIVSFAAWP
jgi:AraC family transcriptional activator of pobA